jgi:tetratricopeptide (TPR) repeat protein
MNLFVIFSSAIALHLSGCGLSSLHDLPTPPPPQLKLMDQLCEGMNGDSDAKDIAVQSLALAYARNGYPNEAMELLKKIESHQGLVGMAKLALEYAHQGENRKAVIFLNEAEKESNRFSISLPRQLSIQMAQAYSAVQNDVKADNWKQKLSDNADLAEVQALIEAEKLRFGRIKLSQVSTRTEPELLEVIVFGATSGRENEMESVDCLAKAEKRVDSMYPVDRVPAYLSVSKGFDKLNRPEDSKRVLSKAESMSLLLSTRIESGTLGRILLADYYANKGDKVKANEWITKARTTISDNGYMAQPLCCSKLAEALWKVGNQQEAQVLWTDALNRARTHVHPRARRMGTLVVLESLLDNKVELTPEQLRMVESVIYDELQTEPLSVNKVENYLDEARATLRSPPAKEKKTTLQGGSSKNKKSATQKKAP